LVFSFFFAQILYISTSIGQNYYLYLKPLDPSGYPINDTSTNNAAVNSIFRKYAVTKFRQSFPKAIDQNIAKKYHIYANGNIDSLKSELENTNLYGEITKAEFYRSSYCSSPLPPVNDLEIISGRSSNWALDNIEANCAWSITQGDPRVVVAIADGDVDTAHIDMKNKFIYKWYYDLTSDYSLHGSKVSGCIFATTNNNVGIAGLANNIKGASYRGMIAWTDTARPPSDSTSASGNVFDAMWQAYLDGRRIINVSWSGDIALYSEALEMTKHGAILVVAAGNRQEYGPSHSSYAGVPGVINVSSINWENKHGTTNSNPILQHEHNAWVDLCALGIDVTTLNAFDRYHTSTGTSISAPLVSGTIALMLSINPCLSPSEVEFILKQTCDPIANASSYPGQLGAGRLNAYKAVRMAQVMSCLNIKGIEINTICRPGKVSGLSNPQFTVKMEGGLPPYKYKWEPIISTTGGISNTTVLDHDDIANPTIISSSAPHIAYYRLIVTDQFLPEKMAIKIIKVQLSDNMTPIVAMRDSYMDMLNEANDQRTTNVYDVDTWTSPDIWNRNTNDLGTTHQNPEYHISAPNFIYTHVKNYGCVASTAGQKLKLYWSKGSTGEKWEDDWKSTNVNDKFGALTMPGGREITPIISGIGIPALAPTAFVILSQEWFPPKPQDFEGSPNSFDACVLARIERTETYPFGMIIPEELGKGVGQNVRNNNTIVTRNMVLTNLNTTDVKVRLRDVIVGNGDNVDQVFNLRFEADRPIYPLMNGDFSTRGKVVLHLGSLYDRWMSAGGKGEYTSRNAQAKTVTMQGNSLLEMDSIYFAASERFTIQIEFALDSSVAIKDSSFQRMHLRQYLNSKPDSLYGAVGYDLKIVPSNTPGYRIAHLDSNSSFILSPNPTNGLVYVVYHGNTNNPCELLVTDMVGKKVLAEQLLFIPNIAKEINLSQYSSGIYLINITNSQGKTEVYKVTKE
jgi:subtilisin family serine protease